MQYWSLTLEQTNVVVISVVPSEHIAPFLMLGLWILLSAEVHVPKPSEAQSFFGLSGHLLGGVKTAMHFVAPAVHDSNAQGCLLPFQQGVGSGSRAPSPSHAEMFLA